MSDNQNSVWSLSAVGRDRPGIVAALTKIFYHHHCNLLDSSMTNLAGQFAVVLLVELGSKTAPPALRAELESLAEEWHLSLAVGPVEANDVEEDDHAPDPWVISIYGADQLGILWKASTVVAEAGYSVTDLSTKRVEGSEPVYILLFEVVPTDICKPIETLERLLGELGKELNCTVNVRPVESAAL